jgi:ABC-type multidrug transport system fused ATPase/permease subunit
MVGERGITSLRRSRKQRTAIARALLPRSAHLLILDDALSSVDTLTEELIPEVWPT